MNRGETLALWKQGPEAWNAWAREMLNRPDKGTDAWSREASADFGPPSEMNCSGLIFPGRARFSSCVFRKSCDFANASFNGDAYFTEAEFLYPASFVRADFLRNVFFDDCKFHDSARFEHCISKGFFNFCNSIFHVVAGFNNSEIYMALFKNARFLKGARFFECVFTRTAAFSSSTFEGANFFRSRFVRQANFEHARFARSANFAEVDFQGATSFGSSVFVCSGNFEAASIERSFDMAGAIFEEVPNFAQAHFAEAPRLDNVTKHGRRGPEAGKDGDELPARWRALKRLALQGHDHIREQEYFAEELKALKHDDEKRVSKSAIWMYEHLSDFGRSMLRPLAAWALLTLLFWWLYLLMHFAALQASTPSWACSSAGALRKALLLSLHKGLPFTGIGSPDKLNQIYACLYGIRGDGSGEPPDRFVPVIPDLVYVFGIVQTLLSLVLIFLFLLALRNHFRIR